MSEPTLGKLLLELPRHPYDWDRCRVTSDAAEENDQPDVAHGLRWMARFKKWPLLVESNHLPWVWLRSRAAMSNAIGGVYDLNRDANITAVLPEFLFELYNESKKKPFSHAVCRMRKKYVECKSFGMAAFVIGAMMLDLTSFAKA